MRKSVSVMMSMPIRRHQPPAPAARRGGLFCAVKIMVGNIYSFFSTMEQTIDFFLVLLRRKAKEET